jgi:hypothetical protein
VDSWAQPICARQPRQRRPRSASVRASRGRLALLCVILRDRYGRARCASVTTAPDVRRMEAADCSLGEVDPFRAPRATSSSLPEGLRSRDRDGILPPRSCLFLKREASPRAPMAARRNAGAVAHIEPRVHRPDRISDERGPRADRLEECLRNGGTVISGGPYRSSESHDITGLSVQGASPRLRLGVVSAEPREDVSASAVSNEASLPKLKPLVGRVPPPQRACGQSTVNPASCTASINFCAARSGWARWLSLASST